MHINLLPRNRYEMDRQKWQVFVISAAIICPLMVIFALHVLLQERANKIRARMASYREEMQGYQHLLVLNNQPKRLQGQYAGTQATESLFVLLSGVRQQSACMTSVVRTKNKLTIDGETRSAADVSGLVKKWAEAPFVAEALLLQLSQLSEGRAQTYRIHMTMADNTSPTSTFK
jgi:hypothetical protein